uniref:UDP-glucose glycoprotein:glucosyltransferase n=1 Tax=Rhizophora mucronata TaxID=61149 RepID=A0A2P2MAB6_RHIMU
MATLWWNMGVVDGMDKQLIFSLLLLDICEY